MKSKRNIVISVVLCFVLAFATIAIVEAKFTLNDFSGFPIKNKCDLTAISTGMKEFLNDVNTNAKYVDFISKSNYSAVKLVIDKSTVYYFVYDSKTKQVNAVESAAENFTVKVTCKQMTKIVQTRDTSNIKFNRLILNRVPQKAKADILTQCFATPWCVNKLLGK